MLTAVPFIALKCSTALFLCFNRTFDTCHAFVSFCLFPLHPRKLLVYYLCNGCLSTEHAANTCNVCLGNGRIRFETTLIARRLVLQVVTAICAFAHQLA